MKRDYLKTLKPVPKPKRKLPKLSQLYSNKFLVADTMGSYEDKRKKKKRLDEAFDHMGG
ncbi:MAG: hypothetical protein SVO01_00215 [Thermotogota bacterium]|nr:hypothetical protein [Thermotogota bacterium]